MTILQIMPLFYEGEKIRLASWDKNAYMYKDNIHVHFVYDNNGTSGDDVRLIVEPAFSLYDLTAEDWEIKMDNKTRKI